MKQTKCKGNKVKPNHKTQTNNIEYEKEKRYTQV